MVRHMVAVERRIDGGGIEQQIAVMIPPGGVVEHQDAARRGAACALEGHVSAVVIDDQQVGAPLKAPREFFCVIRIARQNFQSDPGARKYRHRRQCLAAGHKNHLPPRRPHRLGNRQATHDVASPDGGRSVATEHRNWRDETNSSCWSALGPGVQCSAGQREGSR